MEVLGRILAGAAEKVLEAGAVIVGGHSVTDTEVKFGLAVTGVVHPAKVVRNSGARPGDVLVLTKPLGTGPISTAGKFGKADPDVLAGAVRSMELLNRDAAEAMLEAGVHGATDITGFGFLGHAREVADASGVTLAFEVGRIPLLPGARELAAAKLLSGGAGRNRKFLEGRVAIDPSVPEDLASILYDSETSGGFLIAIPEDGARAVIRALEAKGQSAAIIGRVLPRGALSIEVAP